MKILPQKEGASEMYERPTLYSFLIIIHLYTFTSGVLSKLHGVFSLISAFGLFIFNPKGLKVIIKLRMK